MRHTVLFALVALMTVPSALARTALQSPAPKPGTTPAGLPLQASQASPPTQAPQSPPPAPPPETYSYNPDGRRDPFLSLLGTGGGEMRGPMSRRGEGAAGMMVAEISVRGIMVSRGELVAMIQGPDNKTYIVHPGDKLLDGTIKSVTPQGLIVVQEVNDPLSLVKQREIPKLLKSLENGRQ